MASIAAYCRSCDRTVYVGEDETPICPVCSTPLIETTDQERKET